MQQGPGSQGQPSLALRYGERGAGGENGLRCSLDLRRIGAVVCCRRSVSFCRMQFPEARFGPSVQRGLGAQRPSWLKGHGWGWAQKPFARPILLPHDGEPVGSGFLAPETPSKAAGSREPGSAQPCFTLWRAWGRGQKRLALLSGSEAHWGCGLLSEECFTLQNAVPRSSFWAFGATGPLR